VNELIWVVGFLFLLCLAFLAGMTYEARRQHLQSTPVVPFPSPEERKQLRKDATRALRKLTRKS
jgi:hypothetical protein